MVWQFVKSALDFGTGYAQQQAQNEAAEREAELRTEASAS
jgi:hypothetical protein